MSAHYVEGSSWQILKVSTRPTPESHLEVDWKDEEMTAGINFRLAASDFTIGTIHNAVGRWYGFEYGQPELLRSNAMLAVSGHFSFPLFYRSTATRQVQALSYDYGRYRHSLTHHMVYAANIDRNRIFWSPVGENVFENGWKASCRIVMMQCASVVIKTDLNAGGLIVDSGTSATLLQVGNGLVVQRGC
jgi:hypothetical protein